jgi:hypothetical protein
MLMRQRALLTLLLFAACLHTPGLRTTLTVPILSRTFRLVDLLAGDWLEVTPDSLLRLRFAAELDSVRANDLIDTLHIGDSLLLTGADLVLTPVASGCWSVSPEDLFGPAVGETVPIPQFSHDSVFTSGLPGVGHALLADGVLWVRVENRLPVRLDSLEVAVAGLGPVFVGAVESSACRRTDLGGLIVDSLVRCSLRFWSRGSQGQPVPIEPADSLLISLTVDSLRVRHGRVHPADSTSISGSTQSVSYLGTRHRIRIDSAFFAGGRLDFGLSNRLPFDVSATVRLPELDYCHSLELGAGDSTGYALDLADIGYRSSCPDSSRLTLVCVADRRSGPGTLQFDSTQGLWVRCSGGAPEVLSLAGEALDTVWSPARVETLAVEFPRWARRIRVRSLLLAGFARSAVGFDGVFDLAATALNAAGETAQAGAQWLVPAGSPEHPDSSTLVLNLARLANIGPDRLVVSGRAGVIGPGGLVRASYVAGRAEGIFPLQAKVLPDTVELGPWAAAVDTAVRRQLGLLAGAGVSMQVVNHVPLAASGELRLWRKWSPDTVRLGFGVPAPVIDSALGIVVQPRESLVRVELDRQQAQVFDADSLFTAVRVFLPETDTVALTARDFMQIEESHAELYLDIKPR